MKDRNSIVEEREECGPLLSERGEEPAAKRRALEFEDIYLRSIPAAHAYEKSFMHRDVVSHVAASRTDFIITASVDGHVKFWKKLHNEGIEFVKHFRCHMGSITHLSVNWNGTLMYTMSCDRSIKIFDVCNFDMINMFRLNYTPTTGSWIHNPADAIAALAVAERDSPCIRIYDARSSGEPLHTFEKLHTKEVCLIEYNYPFETAISVDQVGMIEYWTGPKFAYEFPSHGVDWKFKTETDLYELLKVKVLPLCMTVRPDGKEFVIFSNDGKLRFFKFATGKIIKVIDEGVKNYVESKERYNIGNLDFSRKVAVEKELYQNASVLQFTNVTYDDSGNFIIYPTMIGVKVINVKTNRCVRILGKSENVRFLCVALCRSVPSSSGMESIRGQGTAAITIEMEASDNPILKRNDPDPMIVCSAYKKNRFYLFTNSEPFTSAAEHNERDILNEKPRQEDLLTSIPEEPLFKHLIESCVIHTTMGDIHCTLYPKECPKTVENFITLAKNGYYNGNVFHRVIKSFIIQTGDPTGSGSGGASMWGQDFEDEFHPSLKHDRPFIMSMANCGPNTNGSQFFITVTPASHLDNKHTVFGLVHKGMEVVQNINQVKTNPKNNRPFDEISIVSISFPSTLPDGSRNS
uniref:peptidylprolyl isomerase n=1 Tax=Trichuris muris TaxID=70415 RepID=A0A5S6QJC6_TRIMR